MRKELLEGAIFSSQDEKGEQRTPGYEQLTTNKDGYIEVKDLRPGNINLLRHKLLFITLQTRHLLSLKLKKNKQRWSLSKQKIT